MRNRLQMPACAHACTDAGTGTYTGTCTDAGIDTGTDARNRCHAQSRALQKGTADACVEHHCSANVL